MRYYNLSKVQIFLRNEKDKIDRKKILWYTVTVDKPQLHRRSQMEDRREDSGMAYDRTALLRVVRGV